MASTEAETITLSFVVDGRTVSLTLNRNTNIPTDVPIHIIEHGRTTRWQAPAGQVKTVQSLSGVIIVLTLFVTVNSDKQQTDAIRHPDKTLVWFKAEIGAD